MGAARNDGGRNWKCVAGDPKFVSVILSFLIMQTQIRLPRGNGLSAYLLTVPVLNLVRGYFTGLIKSRRDSCILHTKTTAIKHLKPEGVRESHI